MDIKTISNILTEEIMHIMEGWYDNSATPLFSKTDVHRNLGKNPLLVDNGNRTPSDVVRQVSIEDFNGANFNGENVVLSDNKFIIYKIKNFGNDNIKGTISLFGNEKELRRAIDIINGAAKRNGRRIKYRIITSEKNSKRPTTSNSFYEFTLDNGGSWYILKPNPIDSMVKSKLINKK